MAKKLKAELQYAVIIHDESGDTIELFKTEKDAKALLKEIGGN